MAFCTNCGGQVTEGATVCTTCGRAVGQTAGAGAPVSPAVSPTTATVGGGLTENIAGMLAYITFIPAIIFLVLEPYNKNRFVRFHAFQCIFLSVVLFVIHLALMFIPLLGWAVSSLVSLAGFVLWLVCLIQAYGGKMWKIPVIGEMAEKQANAM